METQELHRGRLIDHVQLVVRDLAESQAFYTAVFKCLGVPMGGRWVKVTFQSRRSRYFAATCTDVFSGRLREEPPIRMSRAPPGVFQPFAAVDQ
jgi:catechol 2,3-dioxygenase-like lactoylglutathione lyase family enzyme